MHAPTHACTRSARLLRAQVYPVLRDHDAGLRKAVAEVRDKETREDIQQQVSFQGGGAPVRHSQSTPVPS